MTTILTTTGISLYLNTRREYKIESPEDSTDDQMRHYLRTKPGAASAEANSLLQIAQTYDHLVFLRTETVEAERCTNLLKEFFINRGFKHIRIVELQFQDDEKHIETHGLRNLVNTLITEIEAAQRKGQQVVINATTGFKLESGYSTMIGMLYQVPVKYIHERFKRVVTFNPIALDWDTSLFLYYDEFFQWLDSEPRPQSEVEEWLKAIPDTDREKVQSMLMLPDEDGYIFLSPMGDALRRRFTRETEEAEVAPWPSDAREADFRKKIAKAIVAVRHHPPKDTKAICEKIAKLPWVEGVIGGNYENTTRSGIKGFTENGTIFLLWADNDKATNLTVQTTAKGRPQTRKVANKISEILEIT